MPHRIKRHEQASIFLSQLDADWANLVAIIGPYTLTAHLTQTPYESLVRAVAYQQLHSKAGDAIIARLISLYSHTFPTPNQLLSTKSSELRACGFSARKTETILGIANASLTGVVPSRQEADMMSDEALISRLGTLKGIGRWTVEMLLIFTLERTDVLPADDLGIAKGYQRLKKLEFTPKPKVLADLAQTWKPYRTAASWYLWRVPK